MKIGKWSLLAIEDYLMVFALVRHHPILSILTLQITDILHR